MPVDTIQGSVGMHHNGTTRCYNFPMMSRQLLDCSISLTTPREESAHPADRVCFARANLPSDPTLPTNTK